MPPWDLQLIVSFCIVFISLHLLRKSIEQIKYVFHGINLSPFISRQNRLWLHGSAERQEALLAVVAEPGLRLHHTAWEPWCILSRCRRLGENHGKPDPTGCRKWWTTGSWGPNGRRMEKAETLKWRLCLSLFIFVSLLWGSSIFRRHRTRTMLVTQPETAW